MTKHTIRQMAELAQVSVRSLERVKVILQYGIPELNAACKAETIKIGAAEQIARLPESRQLAELESVLNGGPKKRPTRTIETDLERVVDLLIRLDSKWTADERDIACITIHEFARQLAGLSDEDADDDGTEASL